MYKYLHSMSIISDGLLKLSFGFIFFNYGYAKLNNLILGNGEGLIKMIATMPVFNIFPVFFSWTLALAEISIFLGLLYGVLSFFPFSSLITKLSGILSLFITIVIIYQHIFVWGDNIFTYGPVEFLNIVDGGKAIFGQVLFLPISLYIIFSNSQNSNYISDTK